MTSRPAQATPRTGRCTPDDHPDRPDRPDHHRAAARDRRRDRLARRRRGRPGRGAGQGVAGAARAVPQAPGRTAQPAPHRDLDPDRDRARRERRPARGALPRAPRDRLRHTADRARGEQDDAGPDRQRRTALGAHPGLCAPGLPAAHRQARPDHPARAAAPGLRPLPEAQPVVPRPVHLRPGDLTAHLTLVGTAVLLLTLDVRLALISLVSFPVLIAITAWFRRRSAVVYRRTREAVALVIVHFVESMTGIRAVQAFRREPRNEEIFEHVNDRYRVANLDSFRLNAIFMPSIKLVGNVTIVAVLAYGGWQAYHGHVTVGVLTAFLLYLRQFFEPLQEISQFYNTFQSASAALEKLSGVLAEEPDVPEPARPAAIGT